MTTTSRIRAQTQVLFGHEAAEQALLDAYRSGRIPHAFLIGGPQGIGKATLAFRMARFVLAHPDPMADAVQHAKSLAVAPDNPAAEFVRAQSHPDLLVLERTIGDNGKLRSVIRVDDARRVTGFLGSTAGLGGWRVVIVDAVDDLNAESANALLKGLEEPPSRVLFLLVSHAPGSVLATIRSRCHRLMLRPLSKTGAGAGPGDGDRARSPDDACWLPPRAASAARSRCRRDRLSSCASRRWRCSRVCRTPIRANCMRSPTGLPAATAGFWRSCWTPSTTGCRRDCARSRAMPSRAAHLADIWSEVNQAARSTDIYNLDRKPLIFRAFGRLAEAAGG